MCRLSGCGISDVKFMETSKKLAMIKKTYSDLAGFRCLDPSPSRMIAMDSPRKIEKIIVNDMEITLKTRILISISNWFMMKKEILSMIPVYIKELASDSGENRGSPFLSFTIFVMDELSNQK
jgi:hypothetical protein